MSDDNFFESANFKFLVGSTGDCPPEWGEEDCNYSYHKLYFFERGEGWITIGSQKRIPEPGELFFIPAGTTHSYGHNPEQPIGKYWCHFDIILGDERKLNYHPDCLACRPDPERCTFLFKELLASAQVPPLFRSLQEKSALIGLISLFLEHVNPELMLMSDSRLDRINSFIAEHYAEPLNLTGIADVASLHPNYLISYFKKNYGVTPIEHLQNYRLRRAAVLLEKGEKIQSIAASCGFRDYRYFARLFKRKYGLAPSAYRHSRRG